MMRFCSVVLFLFLCVLFFFFLFFFFFFFFNVTASTEIYTLSLHDALPIFSFVRERARSLWREERRDPVQVLASGRDRKSTRLNSSHLGISYAVFCLKKKKKYIITE